MSLNWVRDNNITKTISGSSGHEGAGYAVAVPTSQFGVLASLNANRGGNFINSELIDAGVKVLNTDNGVVYSVDFVIEGSPDASGIIYANVTIGNGQTPIKKVGSLVAGGDVVILSGNVHLNGIGEEDISLHLSHSSGCNFNVVRWNISVVKTANLIN